MIKRLPEFFNILYRFSHFKTGFSIKLPGIFKTAVRFKPQHGEQMLCCAAYGRIEQIPGNSLSSELNPNSRE